jgi:hypothetical protein
VLTGRLRIELDRHINSNVDIRLRAAKVVSARPWVGAERSDSRHKDFQFSALPAGLSGQGELARQPIGFSLSACCKYAMLLMWQARRLFLRLSERDKMMGRRGETEKIVVKVFVCSYWYNREQIYS